MSNASGGAADTMMAMVSSPMSAATSTSSSFSLQNMLLEESVVSGSTSVATVSDSNDGTRTPKLKLSLHSLQSPESASSPSMGHPVGEEDEEDEEDELTTLYNENGRMNYPMITARNRHSGTTGVFLRPSGASSTAASRRHDSIPKIQQRRGQYFPNDLYKIIMNDFTIQIMEKTPNENASNSNTSLGTANGANIVEEYSELKSLGRGGQATVFSGLEKTTGERVALKIINAGGNSAQMWNEVSC